MQLYHGTTIEAAESIVANGFLLSDNDSSRCCREFKDACIYGFDSYDNAEDFILDQGQNTQAVLSFEIDETDITADDEYGDSAYLASDLTSVKNIQIEWVQG